MDECVVQEPLFGAAHSCFAVTLFASSIDGHDLESDKRFGGYSLLLPDNASEDASIRSFPFAYRPTVSLDATAEVLATNSSPGGEMGSGYIVHTWIKGNMLSGCRWERTFSDTLTKKGSLGRSV